MLSLNSEGQVSKKPKISNGKKKGTKSYFNQSSTDEVDMSPRKRVRRVTYSKKRNEATAKYGTVTKPFPIPDLL